MAENELNILAQRVRDDEVAEFALILVGGADPNAVVGAGESTLYWDRVNNVFYINNDGATAWTLWPGGGGAAVPHQLLDNPWHTDTVTNTPPAAGSIIVSTAGFAWSETVHPGAAAQFLRANAAIPGWAAIVAGDLPNLGAMPALTYGVANAPGAAATYVRTDATIDIYDAIVPGTIQCDAVAGVGVAVAAARRDHQHAIVNAVAVNIGNANAEGVATSFARSDHVHNHVAGLGVDLHHTEVHVVNSTGPHAEAGLTIGHVLQATGAAAFSFGAIAAASLPAHTHSGAGQGGSLVIGTTDTDATAGSVLFAGAAGVIQEDNAGLFYDDANDRLGVGTNAPDGTLHVHTATAGAVGPSADADDLIVENSTNSGISIISPDADLGNLYFGTVSDSAGARVSWEYAADQMSIGTSKIGAELLLQSDNFVTGAVLRSGGEFDALEYIRHLGDIDTYLRFQADNITLRAGGVDMIDIVEAATDYIALGGSELRLSDGFAIGITGNELLTVNAAGTWAFSGISGVSVEDGDWVGAGGGCAWLYDSGNGDISTTATVGFGTTSPGVGDPSTDVEIADSNAISALSINCYDNGASESRLYLRKSDTDTIDTLAQTDDGDWLGVIGFQGVDSGLGWAYGVLIYAIQRGAAGAAYLETDLVMQPYSATGGNANQFVLAGDGLSGFGVSDPLAQLHVDQSSNSAAIPVLTVDQADVSEGFINYIAASAASVVNPISTWTTGNSIQGFVRIEINGAYYWMPYYDAPTS